MIDRLGRNIDRLIGLENCVFFKQCKIELFHFDSN